MALILDKDTRLIDIDFGGVTQSVARNLGERTPSAVSITGNELVNYLLLFPAVHYLPPLHRALGLDWLAISFNINV